MENKKEDSKMILDYQNIWNEKEFAKDGHTLELTLKYMNKTAKEHNIDVEIAAMAIREIMQEVNDGKDFPLICPCGCGIDKSGTSVNHAMKGRMFEISNVVETSRVTILQDRHNKSILNHIAEDNRKYTEKYNKPENLRKTVPISAFIALAFSVIVFLVIS